MKAADHDPPGFCPLRHSVQRGENGVAGAFPGTEQAQERTVEPFDRAEEGERDWRQFAEPGSSQVG